MNKMEKIICLVLGGVFAWYVFFEMPRQQKAAKAVCASEAVCAPAAAPASVAAAVSSPVAPPSAPADPGPDREISVSNAEEVVTFALNKEGVAIKSITLLAYAQNKGAVSGSNPPVTFAFGKGSRALALADMPLAQPSEMVEFRADSPTSVVYRTEQVERRFTLLGGYRIGLHEKFSGAAAQSGAHALSIGSMEMGSSKNDLLSLDSMLSANGKGKPEAVHHSEEEPLEDWLVGGLSGGCSGSKNAAGLPASMSFDLSGRRDWVAIKNRFFVTALASCDQQNTGFGATIARDMSKPTYQPKSASAAVRFASTPAERTSVFYAGPKKQELLWDLGMRDVMEFGMWSWLCYPVVWALNVFNGWFPNYGVAIILLTVLVRVLFWPLTHKSTVGMKKMQEIQPLMKELQAKYKDNPQRLQQETWQLYREKKVNPMSSCLPMLIQIPVFIALFNVLRSAVELRYAPFLWIADLSEPEALGATSWFPFFGGLNILPILMAATMALQSALTPSTGDKSQQKMMMVFMPVMMLFMFYSFPAALSLYWTLSQVFSIVQMWLIRRQSAAGRPAPLTPEVIDPPVTRQMRRHA